MKVRALTVFAKIENWDARELCNEIIARLEGLVKIAEDTFKSSGVEIWTYRLSLPPPPPNINLGKYADALEEAAREIGFNYVSAFHYPIEKILDKGLAENLAQILEGTEKLFVSFYTSHPLDEAVAFEYAKFLVGTSDKIGLEGMARIGLVFNGPLETPYFPGSVSSNTSWSFSIALLYIRDILANWREKRDIENAISVPLDRILDIVGDFPIKNLKFKGVDASLSPWMDESVVRLIEEIGGLDSLSNQKTLTTIWKVNRALENLKKSKKLIGFNEVMLAVAEDNRAKDEIYSQELNLKLLLELSIACMNGIDMVVVPNDINFLSNLILDINVVANAKGKPYGFRAIPASGKPGDTVDLGRFGRTPIIGW